MAELIIGAITYKGEASAVVLTSTNAPESAPSLAGLFTVTASPDSSSFSAVGSLKLRPDGSATFNATLEDGSKLTADLTILAAGAWTASLIDLRGICKATGQVICYMPITDAEQELSYHESFTACGRGEEASQTPAPLLIQASTRQS